MELGSCWKEIWDHLDFFFWRKAKARNCGENARNCSNAGVTGCPLPKSKRSQGRTSPPCWSHQVQRDVWKSDPKKVTSSRREFWVDKTTPRTGCSYSERGLCGMGREIIPEKPKAWLWKNSLDFIKEFWHTGMGLAHGLEISVGIGWKNPVFFGWIPLIPLHEQLEMLQSQVVSKEMIMDNHG